MPFTEEQMKQVFDTNLIDFAVQNGFQIEKKYSNIGYYSLNSSFHPPAFLIY